MKCKNCGFISNKDFYRCPYCGQIHEEEGVVLKKSVKIGSEFSIQLRTVFYIFFLNIIGIAVLADWYFNFSYSLSLWAFIVCFGAITVISVSSAKRNNISTIEKADFFILISLMMCCGLCRIDGLFDARKYFPGIVIPSFLIVASILSIILIFHRRSSHSKLRPLWTEALLLFHVVIMVIIFVFFMVNKYCVENGVENPPFAYLQLGMTKGHPTVLYNIEQTLIFIALGLTGFYFINYNVMLVGYILRKVKNIYGGQGD